MSKISGSLIERASERIEVEPIKSVSVYVSIIGEKKKPRANDKLVQLVIIVVILSGKAHTFRVEDGQTGREGNRESEQLRSEKCSKV